MTRKIYQAAIIGCGMIGRVHAYAYRTMRFFFPQTEFDVRIKYVCTAHEETAREMRELTGAQFAITSWQQAVEDPEVDLVNICLPNDLHLPVLKAAIQAQKAIYCDKPVVASWQEARQLHEMLNHYRQPAQMTFQNRFFPATIRAKQLIDEGHIGKVEQFRFAYLHSGNIDPNAPMRWKLSGRRGGGVINDLASHVVDLLEWLLCPVERVCAMARTVYPSRQVDGRDVPVDGEDAMMALLRLQSDAQGVIEVSKVATGSEDELRFEIHGRKGALRFCLRHPQVLEFYSMEAPASPAGGHRGWLTIDCGGRYPDLPRTAMPGPKFAVGWLRSHVACLSHFVNAVHKKEAAKPSLADGLRVQAVLEAIHRSIAQESRWVQVPEFTEPTP